MDADTAEPKDELLPMTKLWAKSIGSNAKTVSEVLNPRDPAVRITNR